MRRILTGSAVASAALVLLLPASAGAGLGFTVEQGFASPTVELGSAKASKLCDIGIQETRYVPVAGRPRSSTPHRRRLRAARSPESARSSWAAPGWPA